MVNNSCLILDQIATPQNKTLEKLRGTLKRIDKEEESLEWPNVEEELRDSLDRLKDTNSKFGNESLEEDISKISQMVEKVIKEKKTKTGRDLIDQIRSLNFKLIDDLIETFKHCHT